MRWYSYTIYFAPKVAGTDGSRDSSEAIKEPFADRSHRLGSRVGAQLGFTGMDVETEEVLHRRQIRQFCPTAKYYVRTSSTFGDR